MRIKSLHIPAQPHLGLKEIQMARLGHVVVLAGKNGAGKTRLLGRISGWKTPFSNESSNTPEYYQEVYWLRQPLETRGIEHRQRNWWLNDEEWAHYLSAVITIAPDLQKTVRDQLYRLDFDQPGSPEIHRFVPKPTKLQDPADLPLNQMMEQSAQSQSLGISNVDKTTLSRIQTLQNAWFNVTHPNSTVTDEAREGAITRYFALKEILEKILGTELLRDENGQATLFGFPLGKSRLSGGQTVLIQFFTALAAQAHKLSDVIIVLDEPENSLHPSALIDVIEALQKILTNGQIWVATHSVSLLSHFDPDCIWWVQNGSVKHVGSQPEQVLADLVGEEERQEKLHRFLGLPAEFAAINFARQCLEAPQVVMTGSRDPQIEQVYELLATANETPAVRLLDFGAGRGRLAAALAERPPAGLQIDYVAFDPSDAHRQECEKSIGALHGSAHGRYFSCASALIQWAAENPVDVVLLCNVLHEIPPQSWEPLFATIRNVVRPTGSVVIVEDTEMRTGELAHEAGFVVLDTPALGALFCLKEEEIVLLSRLDGRLKAHRVPAMALTRISPVTVRQSLECVRETASAKVFEIRQMNDRSFRHGRRHAFHTEQVANAHLALSLLPT